MTERGRLVLFVTGNESRGDDAVGPVLLRRLEPELGPDVRVVLDFQLQVEHALELRDADLALFIDAACGLGAPFAFGEVVGATSVSSFSHALSPGAVLDVFRQVERAEPPPGFVVGVRAQDFGLGAELSESCSQAIKPTLDFVRRLLACPDAAAWRSLAQLRTRSEPRSGKNSAV